MDPITHGICGGLAASICSSVTYRRHAALLGALSAMAPDLDVLIRSSTDPLLSLEYHRHFTHSFAFIPLGGILVALILKPLFFRKLSWSIAFLFALVGYSTHSLLDACTNYGTLLYWPFSRERVSWSIISIIDPIFTLTLLGGLLWGLKTSSVRPIRGVIFFGLAYLTLGIIQRDRATDLMFRLSHQRGHSVMHYEVKPSFGNLIVWRSIYEAKVDGVDRFFIDAIRLPWGTFEGYVEGGSLPKLGPLSSRDPSKMRFDLDRFRWFSDDFLVSLEWEDRIFYGDIRFSLLPDGLKPLWGISFDFDKGDTRVRFDRLAEMEEGSVYRLWRMITGRLPFQKI